jgi:hypothetical protein
MSPDPPLGFIFFSRRGGKDVMELPIKVIKRLLTEGSIRIAEMHVHNVSVVILSVFAGAIHHQIEAGSAY